MSWTEVYQLERKIAGLERELKVLRYRRQSLKAAVMMREKWRRPEFREKAMASISRGVRASAERLGEYRHNQKNKLPWLVGTVERNRYRALKRIGLTRAEAVEKVRHEFAGLPARVSAPEERGDQAHVSTE